MKIGYLGPRGTFSNEVANIVYGDDSILKVPYKTISETILALENGEIDNAVVPIENSIQGPVTETIDKLMKTKNITIVDEKVIKINQNLMAKDDIDLSEIKAVYSHPQALAQCKGFIDEYLTNAEIVPISSTALAAQEVSKMDGVACISNKACVDVYNLTMLKENIQDNDTNETKFWVLNTIGDIDRSNKSKMTLVFALKHEPGALYKALGIFEKHHINLTKIESRPTKEKLGEYYFWVDMDIVGIDLDSFEKELNLGVLKYKILGIY